MLAYLARRLAMTVPTLLLVSVAVFTLVRLIPGDPVLLMLGDSAEPPRWRRCAKGWDSTSRFPCSSCTGSAG